MNIQNKHEVSPRTSEVDAMSTIRDEDELATGFYEPRDGHRDRHLSEGNMSGLNATAFLVGLVMTLGPLAAYAFGAR